MRTRNSKMGIFDRFQADVAFHIETSHLICSENQISAWNETLALNGSTRKKIVQSSDEKVEHRHRPSGHIAPIKCL